MWSSSRVRFPSSPAVVRVWCLQVSYKPQKIAPKFAGSVRLLFHEKIRESAAHPQFNTDVIKPMMIEPIIDQEVEHLSGGELQRVALCLCLGKPADVYLIDEPSAYLDSEQRISASKVRGAAVVVCWWQVRSLRWWAVVCLYNCIWSHFVWWCPRLSSSQLW